MRIEDLPDVNVMVRGDWPGREEFGVFDRLMRRWPNRQPLALCPTRAAAEAAARLLNVGEDPIHYEDCYVCRSAFRDPHLPYFVLPCWGFSP